MDAKNGVTLAVTPSSAPLQDKIVTRHYEALAFKAFGVVQYALSYFLYRFFV